jgi:hypothetical protein
VISARRGSLKPMDNENDGLGVPNDFGDDATARIPLLA